MKISVINALNTSGIKFGLKNSSMNQKTQSEKHALAPNYAFFSPINFRGAIDLELRKKVLNSINTNKPLSTEGYKGVAYSVDYNGKKYVAKIARHKDYSFENEANVLKKVPKNLVSSQRYVDYFKDPSGKDILVSTFVEGHKGVLDSKDDFKKYFDILSQLDKAGVLNGDLNMANCLFDKDNISLIDYGEGSTFRFGESYDELYPDFYAKSNAVNLEHNGIPDCIQKWHLDKKNTKELFRTYLEQKSIFYGNHAALLEKTLGNEAQKFIDFEKNLARVLKNPSDKVLENEAGRIDIMYTFEYADTSVNYHKIPKDAARNWAMVLDKTHNAIKNVQKHLRSGELTPEEKTYFMYQHKLLQQMYNTFCEWSGGTFEWFGRIMSTPENELQGNELTLRQNKDIQTSYIPPDLHSFVMG